MSRVSPAQPRAMIFTLSALLYLSIAFAAPAGATPQFTTLVNFTGANGEYPKGLIQGSDGNFYGTTGDGGSSISPNNPYGDGTVFRLSPSGTLTTLVNFTGTNGSVPESSLIEGSDGSFYGITFYGGRSGNGTHYSGDGTVFKVSPAGALTTLVNFTGANGSFPNGGLIQGSDGNFYGTTQNGGSSISPNNPYGDGTVFKLTPAGVLTTLVNFSGTNGLGPEAALIEDSAGNLYGTTTSGGSSGYVGYGTVFELSPPSAGAATWNLATLVNFSGTNGEYPSAALIQGSDGNLYGTTEYGGNSISSKSPDGDGTVFKLTPSGTLTTLVNFTGTNGSVPESSLIEGSDGNFYGTTYFGGSAYVSGDSGNGTVFKLTPAGVLTTLVNFTGTNGESPNAGLIEGNDGDLYGATTQGGSSYVAGGSAGDGAVFRIALVAPPAAVTGFAPASGPAGTVVTITGIDLAGATVVGFMDQHAPSFTIDGTGTQITATVPRGAVTGPIALLVDGIEIKTATNFTVTPSPPAPVITGFAPASGPAGTPVTITGTNLTGTTIVGFMGKHATSFTVNPVGTQITTTVPAGAVTGPVAVLTNGIEAKSPTSFTITP